MADVYAPEGLKELASSPFSRTDHVLHGATALRDVDEDR